MRQAKEGQVIFSEVRRVPVEVSKLALLLAPIVVEVDAESAPAATAIKDAVLDVSRDRYASGHGLNREIVLCETL
jgi:hypothetical protein